VTNFLFSFYSAFSGQLFYDALCGSLFNLIFTALPVMGAAVFNTPVSRENALRFPVMYKTGQNFESFNLTILFFWLFEGFCHACVVFFCAMYLFGDTVTDPNGLDNDIWLTSTAMFSYMVVVVSVKLALECVTWVWVTHFFFWGSLVAYLVWILVYCWGLFTPDMYWVSYRMLSMAVFWWGLLMVNIFALLPDLTFMYVQRTFWPKPEDIVMEIENDLVDDPEVRQKNLSLSSAAASPVKSSSSGPRGPSNSAQQLQAIELEEKAYVDT